MKAWLLGALISSQVFGGESQLHIKNFSFDYRAPLGEGVADSFSYGKELSELQKVKVERVGDDFEILLEGVEDRHLTLEAAPDFITGADFIRINSLFLTVSESLSLILDSAYFQSPFRILELRSFEVKCEIYKRCLESLSLKAKSIHSNGEGLSGEIFDQSTPVVEVSELDLRIQKGKFLLRGDVRAQFSGKVRSKGVIKYEASSKTITLRVEEVKFGILNVTSKVFEELKRHESEKMKVKYPHIYLML